MSGQEDLDLIGAWRLVGAYVVDQESGNRLDTYGAEPFGVAVFEANGRMIAMLIASDRSPIASEADMARRFKSMVAYTGTWSFDGKELVTKVDGAWDPSWIGTEQVRYCTFDGHKLSIRTAPIANRVVLGQHVIGYLDWEREP